MTLRRISRAALILLALIWAALPEALAQSPTILGGAQERQPRYGELENFTILSYTDLNGWDQAAEFRVSKDGKYAYISNYQGFSIVDVSDPTKPRVVSQTKNDPSVQSQYIDVLGNLLVINQDGVRDEKSKRGPAAFGCSTSAIRPSRVKSDSSKPMSPRGAACTASGCTKMPSKASSHSSPRRSKTSP